MMKIFKIFLLIVVCIMTFASCAQNSNQVKDKSDRPVEKYWGRPTDGPG